MAQINVNNLTFGYEESFDNVFENVSFSIDTNWRLGLVGRNGKGKTTFLRLLSGEYQYEGTIAAGSVFEYYPYTIKEEYMSKMAAEFIDELKTGAEQWRVIAELSKLGQDAEILYRPFDTLSFGERTKVGLALLFSGDNDFLLVDEPTNHLDSESREIVKSYLADKKGFILVSHDRDLLDACVDHVLVLNRKSIEVQAGNFSSWWDNKNKKDAFFTMENEKHKKEIVKLREASQRTRQWADNNEKTKIGFDPVKEHDRFLDTRAYIGAKTKKMQSRVKQLETRIENQIREKEGLLADIENPAELKLFPLLHNKERLILASDLCLRYADGDKNLVEHLSFEIKQGERIAIRGANGCGKSSIIKAVLNSLEGDACSALADNLIVSGEIKTASGLKVSYISQDTSKLAGTVHSFCESRGFDEGLFCAILRQLDFSRTQLAGNMEEFSEGQKKKVLISASLLTPAHIYIWDEPLNYIDVFSRIQLESVILKYKPTLLFVEHDVRFCEKIATDTIQIIIQK